ncbi:MAG: TraM recognition domain-containing protein, partial [Pseudomonadota bacterium]
QGRSYGLHVWPFVISFGQLENLYGHDGAQDFLASTDYFTAFGVQDDRTAEVISKRIGYVTSDDVAPELNQIHRTIEVEEAYRANQAQNINHANNMSAELDEANRTLAEERRYENDLASWKFVAFFSKSLAGQVPVRRQIVRPRTTLVTAQRPQELYAQADAVRARIGKLRMSPEEIRIKTKPQSIFNTMISRNMYLETPSGWCWMYLLPHFATFTEGSVGAYLAMKRRTYRLSDLADSPRLRAAQQALEGLGTPLPPYELISNVPPKK